MRRFDTANIARRLMAIANRLAYTNDTIGSLSSAVWLIVTPTVRQAAM